MARLFLIVLAGPLAIVLALSVHGWIRAGYPRPPAEPPGLDAEDLRIAARVAERALARFDALPPPERAALRATLVRHLVTPRAWVESLERRDPAVVCLGESHTPATRRFLARAFFARYRTDVLLLETVAARLEEIERRVAAGRRYVPLLDADIAAVLRAARARNPELVVRGIEETRAQWRVRQGRAGSRERALARNFWAAYRPGVRHVILYGALHCADAPHWLFRHLRARARAAVAMHGVRVSGEDRHRPTKALVLFLRRLGLVDGDFAVLEVGALPAPVGEWFPLLRQQVLARYDTLVVFRRPTPG